MKVVYLWVATFQAEQSNTGQIQPSLLIIKLHSITHTHKLIILQQLFEFTIHASYFKFRFKDKNQAKVFLSFNLIDRLESMHNQPYNISLIKQKI